MKEATRNHPTMYGLSTCGWCAKARRWLDDNAVVYDCVYVDLLTEEEKTNLLGELHERIGRVAFPTVFFGADCVVGYHPEEYERLAERQV